MGSRGLVYRAALVLVLGSWRLANPTDAAAEAIGVCSVHFCDGSCTSQSLCDPSCTPVCVYTGSCYGGEPMVATDCGWGDQ